VHFVLSIAGLLAVWFTASFPREHRIVVEQARLPSGETADLLIVDGVIASIGTVERRDGDVVVRARGGAVIAGRRRRFESMVEWSEVIEGPALGLTSVVLPSDAFDRNWLEGVRSRAAWIGPRLAIAGEENAQPRVSPGFPAELLVLDPDSRALSQAVVGDRVLRRADLETRREMLAEARRRLATLPPPEARRRGLQVVAAGLPVGRVDLSPDGRSILERTVAPHPIEREWEVRSEPHGWTVLLKEDGVIRATIRRDAAGVTADAANGRHLAIPHADGWPSMDLAATAASESDRLLRLSAEGVLEVPVVVLEASPEGLTLRPDRLRFRSLEPAAVPFRMRPGERGFEVVAADARRGLVVLGPDGFPLRAWETGPVGDVEWVGPATDPV
jgi:hypothetical protein